VQYGRLLSPIFAVESTDEGCRSLTQSFGVNSRQFTIAKLGFKKLQKHLSIVWCKLQRIFRYLKPFRRDLRVWWIERQTDRQMDRLYCYDSKCRASFTLCDQSLKCGQQQATYTTTKLLIRGTVLARI